MSREMKTKDPSTKKGVLLLVLVSLFSCGPQVSDVTKECVLNDDQAKSLIGKWSVRPVPIAVIANDFSSTELPAIRAAIDTWNEFFKNSKGFSFFLESGSGNLSQLSSSTVRLQSSTVCQQNMVSANGFSRPIVIQKVRSGWTHGSAAMGITSTCPVPTSGSTTRSFYAALLEVNYQDFFNSGQPIPDLQSVLTHELGHLAGLDHSCTSNGVTGFVSCNEAPADYLSALMYPGLGFDGTRGRLSRTIRSNDQQRANCLY